MSAADAFQAAQALALQDEPGMVYSRALIAYSEAEDCFYLVSDDRQAAIPFPRGLSGHVADIVAETDNRLWCHGGTIRWQERKR